MAGMQAETRRFQGTVHSPVVTRREFFFEGEAVRSISAR